MKSTFDLSPAIDALAMLCTHHGFDATATLQKLASRKRTFFFRIRTKMKCRSVTRLGEDEVRHLGIFAPAYSLCVGGYSDLIFFIGTYRDGDGKTISYVSVTTRQVLERRIDDGDWSSEDDEDATESDEDNLM